MFILLIPWQHVSSLKTKCHILTLHTDKQLPIHLHPLRQAQIYGCLVRPTSLALQGQRISTCLVGDPNNLQKCPPLQLLCMIYLCPKQNRSRAPESNLNFPRTGMLLITKKKQTAERISASQPGVAKISLQEAERKPWGRSSSQHECMQYGSWGKINSSSCA